MSISKSEKFKLVLDVLNSAQQDLFEGQYSASNITDVNQTDAENLFIALYTGMNKYKQYQVFTVDASFEDLVIKANSVQDKLGFLSAGDVDQFSYRMTVSTADRIEFSFVVFKRVRILLNDGEGNRIPGEFESIVRGYVFDLEFRRFDDSTIALLKFPTMVVEPNKLYDYKDETDFIIDWVSQKLDYGLIPTNLKGFFTWMESNNVYDKTGFKAYSLPTAKAVVDATFSIDLSRNPSSKRVYEALDAHIQPTVADWVLQVLKSGVKDKKVTLDDHQINFISDAISEMDFCEGYFSLIHSSCTFGRGYINYSKDKIKLKYTLEYERDRHDLIRVTKQGWGMFEPIYRELETYIRES
ncbi:hypothetical protein Bb109J_c0305 [Bdellovibrio bacteriovorus]|uniref:hypothetical protein n=1 Tax=Bdellovibrio bacteriovorus TaxID=959 RepID=UPI00045BF66E|nr:hypothetical protein [Bdellovibrio bacteriovorus]AHZ85964.1 hypothetical protein EP01_13610 [Bdellovibrio bacteriovorus]BEV66885.1 hypothetical protein Bb109J_c0305 [Bdellovibrio bacteriovorus]